MSDPNDPGLMRATIPTDTPADLMTSDYLSKVVKVSGIPDIVKQLEVAIAASGIPDFNAIAFRGMSGALVVPMLALSLKKEIVICRKPAEKAHGYALEGYYGGGNYIIVDDFISCGDTVRSIIGVIDNYPNGNCGQSAEGITYGYARKPPHQPFQLVGIFVYLRKGTATFDHAKHGVIPVFGVAEAEAIQLSR